MKIANRKQFMKAVGAKMTNNQWSWVGVNHKKKQVFFTTWSHEKKSGGKYLIYDRVWGTGGSRVSPGRADAYKALDLVKNKEYQVCLMMAKGDISGGGIRIKKVSSFWYTADYRIENAGTDKEKVRATPLKEFNACDM